MSFASFKTAIEVGDTVILFVNVHHTYAIKVNPTITNKVGEIVPYIFQTIYGALKVQSLIGQKYGMKIKLSRGWAYVLHPTPELWSRTLLHRTQILYTPDISLIILQLDIKPGSFVIEAGTGSGSLSHALIRTVKPNGHLFTFDFHSSRVNIVSKEFDEHCVSPFVTVQHRDVCQDGFGVNMEYKADAVFLDLPKPWEVVPLAVIVFKSKGGRFVSFSPCIEQTQKTVAALMKCGFRDIKTMECLQKELTVQERLMPVLDVKTLDKKDQNSFLTAKASYKVPGHTGYLTAATLPPLRLRFCSVPVSNDVDTEINLTMDTL